MFSFCIQLCILSFDNAAFFCSGVAPVSSVTYTHCHLCLVMQKTSASGVAFKKCYGCCGSVLLDLRFFLFIFMSRSM